MEIWNDPTMDKDQRTQSNMGLCWPWKTFETFAQSLCYVNIRGLITRLSALFGLPFCVKNIRTSFHQAKLSLFEMKKSEGAAQSRMKKKLGNIKISLSLLLTSS